MYEDGENLGDSEDDNFYVPSVDSEDDSNPSVDIAKRSPNKIYVSIDGGSFDNIVEKDRFLEIHQFSSSQPLVKGKTQLSTKRYV